MTQNFSDEIAQQASDWSDIVQNIQMLSQSQTMVHAAISCILYYQKFTDICRK